MDSVKNRNLGRAAFPNAATPAKAPQPESTKAADAAKTSAAQKATAGKAAEFSRDKPATEAGTKVAAQQVGADGQLVGSDGEPVQGNALLNARIALSTDGSLGRSVNPFPDRPPPTAPLPSVNPFPDQPPSPVEPTTQTVTPDEPDPVLPTVNPFPDRPPPTRPLPTVNPFPDRGGDEPE